MIIDNTNFSNISLYTLSSKMNDEKKSKAQLIKELLKLRQQIADLKRSEIDIQKLSRAVEQSADHVIITDKDGSIEYVNPSFESLTGHKLNDIIGLTPRILKSGKHPESFYENIWSIILSGKAYRGISINKKKNGDFYYEEKTITPIKDSKGNITHFISTGKDITKQKQAEKEKEKIQSQLIQAQKIETIGTLASGVAHDFNNLLNVIMGYSELTMSNIDETNPLYEDLKEIYLAGERATKLTRQLLFFSHKQPIKQTIFNINETVSNLLKMLNRLISKDITIDTVLHPILWITKGDESAIEQVIMNLVINAQDAMPNGGTITIQTENIILSEEESKELSNGQAGLFICLSVEDTGTGISEENIKNIFEPFFTTKAPEKGTGLGLSVTFSIVNDHNGWINIDSKLSQGTTFKVYLPYVDEIQEAENQETISLSEYQGKGEHILLVDYDDSVREFSTRVLRENGYIVIDTDSSEEALKIFDDEEGKFDLILSDAVLPKKNALQLAEELLSQKPDLRFLLTSGHTDKPAYWSSIQEKGFQFLQKPFSIKDLLKAVRQTLSIDKKKIR